MNKNGLIEYMSDVYSVSRSDAADAYNMVITPWVNLILGVMIVVSVVMMLGSPARSSLDGSQDGSADIPEE